ncbi:Sas10/Utp3/C1D family-domain-containing protein [Gautieria morchelliformis]|nr:Sas10/Utp3/C1D family-domain-containing protein [Gautieria morchelliformis]
MDSLLSMERSLDSLEEALEPLLNTSLSQTLSELDLLQKAKLQVLLPYVVNDLVFIYLRTRGINPKTHPVVKELDRIKQYFDKIKKAEEPEEKRRFAVDQGAATRFIKHTIKESQASLDPPRRGTHTRFTASDTTVIGSSASAAATAKINARASKNQTAESSSEESDLEVFGDGPNTENVATEYPTSSEKAGKATVETSTSKKRRRGMDPWAGRRLFT